MTTPSQIDLRPFRITDHDQTCDGMHKGPDGIYEGVKLGEVAWSCDAGETELYCLACYQEILAELRRP